MLYDTFDRLTAEMVTQGYGTSVHFSTVRRFVYDGTQLIATVEGGEVNRFLHGPVVDMILANDEVTSDGQDFPAWLLSDQQNSVKTALGSDGVTVGDYTAFGQVKQQAGTGSVHTANMLLTCFTGRPYDEYTGLQNNWHRWYDAALSQWLSEDPLGFGGGDTNLRRYVGNSPTNGVDPSGLEPPPENGEIYPTPGTPEGDQYQKDKLRKGRANCPIYNFFDDIFNPAYGSFDFVVGNGIGPFVGGPGPMRPPGSLPPKWVGVNVPFPGWDPTLPPPGTEWNGRPGSIPGGPRGSFVNPRTGEVYRPDLYHPDPIGPHWDYRNPDGGWRIWPDGSIWPKKK